MIFSYRDAKKLASQLWQQDEILNKKRRWLVNPYGTTADGSKKKLKRLKFLNDIFLTESFVRSDEVSYEIVKNEVEKSFGAYNDTHKPHHVVQNFFQIFANFDIESYSSNPSPFLNKLYAVMNALSNKALCHVTNLISNTRNQFEKTRPTMVEIIQHHLPRFFEKSSKEDIQTLMEKLSETFKDPSNFQETQLSLRTPLTQSLLSSIQNALALIDKMHLQVLIAMNRKLSQVSTVPKFPPPAFTRRKDELLNVINKRCCMFLANLRDDLDLPEPFAKALSVVQLSLKQKTKSFEVINSEFYPFSPEVVGLQNDVLRALWSLQKVRTRELKTLQHYVDPKGNIPIKAFRNSLSKYLLEILFECDLIGIPDDVLCIIAALNRKSRRKARLFTKELVNEEIEGVLVISSQLKRIVSDTYENEVEPLRSSNYCENNDFGLADDSYVNASVDCETHSCLYDKTEGAGESNGFIYMDNDITLETDVSESNDNHIKEACSVDGFIKKLRAMEQADSTDFMAVDTSKKHNLKAENEITSQHLCQEGSSLMRDSFIQEICDETSLVTYKLIGHILDKFIHVNGTDCDEMTRNYLRGESSLQSQDVELLKPSTKMKSEILTGSLQEMLPNLSNSCLKKVKKLMDLEEN